MAYLYGVFFSYKRCKVNEQWLKQIFLPFCDDFLNNVLPQHPGLLIDANRITQWLDLSNVQINAANYVMGYSITFQKAASGYYLHMAKIFHPLKTNS
jgi:hypothetical protein